MKLAKGTLIRVTLDSAFTSGFAHVAWAGGELWIVEKESENKTVYAKSLTTGKRYVWLEGEYEVS